MVKSGYRILKHRSAVKCSWTDKFQDLYEEHPITKVEISKDDTLKDPTIVPPDAPVSLCSQFQCSYVCIFVDDSETRVETTVHSGDIVLMPSMF